MATHFDFVVVGAGVAGATAVETLRAEGASGSILLLGDESHLPYQRGPLSKRFITSDPAQSPPLVLSEAKYRELDVELRVGTRVTSVQPQQQCLRTDKQGSIGYGQLLIATGATPRRLDIPGHTLSGIHYLRTLTDARALRADAQAARQAVVIGGSFTGLEVAASLRELGLKVTLIERGGLLDKLHTPEISAFFRRVFEERGVEVITQDVPAAFHGEGRVTSVSTRGGRTLACDMVVVGIGVTAQTRFLQGSGIGLDKGIVVDRFLQTNIPGIFAAGDVAYFFDPVFQCRRRIGHWDNAVKQGRQAARNMLGQNLPYDRVSYFYSHIFDVSFNLLGMVGPEQERIERGSLQDGSFAAFYLHGDVPQALFSLGRPSDETRVTESLIRHKANLKHSKHHLSDPSFRLEHIPNQTVFVMQGGGAYGAFEYGVVKALDASGIRPDIVAGVSIGAFNGAIIAGNPDRPAQALEAFWQDLITETAHIPDENLRRLVAYGQFTLFGVPKFFRPRWLMPMWMPEQWPLNWTSLYDTTPARQLLQKHVDFSRLKASPIRLLVSAVNVETSELAVFDSYVDELTPDHILASGSLPPSFPWTTIGNKHYWDGGIVSNSPLEQVVERCGSAGKRVFIIDLFPGQRTALPANLMDVASRRAEVLFSERIRNDIKTRDRVSSFQKLVEEIVSELPASIAGQIRHQPRFIQMMGEEAPMTVTRIVREHSEDASSSGGHDFSRSSIEKLIDSGYNMALKALAQSTQTSRAGQAPGSETTHHEEQPDAKL